VQFLEPIPPGLRPREFLQTLETRIESATTVLVAEGQSLLRRNETGAPVVAG
jgi:hypothetical protein